MESGLWMWYYWVNVSTVDRRLGFLFGLLQTALIKKKTHTQKNKLLILKRHRDSQIFRSFWRFWKTVANLWLQDRPGPFTDSTMLLSACCSSGGKSWPVLQLPTCLAMQWTVIESAVCLRHCWDTPPFPSDIPLAGVCPRKRLFVVGSWGFSWTLLQPWSEGSQRTCVL